MIKNYSKIFVLIADNGEIKVKKIEYLSNSKINVKYETKSIDIDDKDEKSKEDFLKDMDFKKVR